MSPYWSIIGTVVGAGLGASLSLTIGPSGTSGLIIQMVSWAIFAHLLIGLRAGYRLSQIAPAVRSAPCALSY